MVRFSTLNMNSYSPEEWTDTDYIAKGTEALARVLIALDIQIS
jgi:hypothetical protein